MKRIVYCVLVLMLLTASAQAAKVTFVNDSSKKVFVRCITAGTVSPKDEYRQKIPSSKRHHRKDFEMGRRVAAAWTLDGKYCDAMVFNVEDGMEIIISDDPGSNGKGIIFGAACADCNAD